MVIFKVLFEVSNKLNFKYGQKLLDNIIDGVHFFQVSKHEKKVTQFLLLLLFCTIFLRGKTDHRRSSNVFTVGENK